MTPESVAEILSSPLAQELFASNIPAHIAYTGLDGAPRSVPISYTFDDGTFRISSPLHARKVAALQADPRIALSIDTTGAWPARALLVRGVAAVELSEGLPDHYLDATTRTLGADVTGFIASALAPLHPEWATVTITPHWAKLIDFETVYTEALTELFAQAQAG